MYYISEKACTWYIILTPLFGDVSKNFQASFYSLAINRDKMTCSLMQQFLLYYGLGIEKKWLLSGNGLF